jgi:hypothetical protein
MANKHYKIIDNTVIELNGKNYVVETFNLSLKEFLEKNFDKEIYIYGPSLQTQHIRAIII